MKNIKKTITLILSSMLLFSCADGNTRTTSKEVDDYEYSTDTVRDFRKPDFVRSEDEEKIVTCDKLILHYVNEDKACSGRAFYIWGQGVNGVEYSSREDGDIVKYTEDGTGMTITMDFVNDARFQKLAGLGQISYIIKYQMRSPTDLNWAGQSEDVTLKYEDFPPVDGVCEVWCAPAAGGGIAHFASEAETKVEGVKLAYFTDFKTIKCFTTDGATTVSYSLYAFDETYFRTAVTARPLIKENYLVKQGESSAKEFEIKLKYNAHINIVYQLVTVDASSTSGLMKQIFVSLEKLYTTDRFEQLYTYDGNDLGVTYTPAKTTFKVWAPVAACVTLQVYASDTITAFGGNNSYQGFHMCYQRNGVWTLTLIGNLYGRYYNYKVDTWAGSDVAMDPYATSAGANGQRGLIYDKNNEDVTPEGWDTVPVKWDGTSRDIKSPQELTVYEVHVQDFTGDSSWISNKDNARGTFNAFVEEGTTYTKDEKTVTTGFDHLKDLGIGAVQLMPMFDYDNDEVVKPGYNWGYNPQNYNVVEGLYSSDPHNGFARVKEFKNLVLKCAENGMRVIMDVVYNHMSSASSSYFNKFMPRYFFRYTPEGELYDGSGCHNEFRSEATMARKYIVDSVCMWARDYKVKGFRFDLMGLLDVGTMKALKVALGQIDKDIYVYGEGWTAAGFHGGYDYENKKQSEGAFCCNGSGNQVYSQLYKTQDLECELGGFNDLGRNAIKGGNDQGWGSDSHLPGWGFISKGDDASYENRMAIQHMIYGEHGNHETVLGSNPAQTVNYASCHDNWTLRDQLYYTLGNGSSAGNGYDIMHASETVHALIFASNACAFMLGGEELLRTKDVDFVTDQEAFDEIPLTTYDTVYGHKLSHNSYCLPIEVNSFKWGNKISVEFDSQKGDTTYTVDTYAENLTGKFAEMIALHKKLPKYSYSELFEGTETKSPISQVTSKNNPVINMSWCADQSAGGECGIGIQFDEIFIFAAGRNFSKVGAGSVPHWGNPLFTTGGNVNYKDGCLELGNGAVGNGFAFTCYNAKGAR